MDNREAGRGLVLMDRKREFFEEYSESMIELFKNLCPVRHTLSAALFGLNPTSSFFNPWLLSLFFLRK